MDIQQDCARTMYNNKIPRYQDHHPTARFFTKLDLSKTFIINGNKYSQKQINLKAKNELQIETYGLPPLKMMDDISRTSVSQSMYTINILMMLFVCLFVLLLLLLLVVCCCCCCYYVVIILSLLQALLFAHKIAPTTPKLNLHQSQFVTDSIITTNTNNTTTPHLNLNHSPIRCSSPSIKTKASTTAAATPLSPSPYDTRFQLADNTYKLFLADGMKASDRRVRRSNQKMGDQLSRAMLPSYNKEIDLSRSVASVSSLSGSKGGEVRSSSSSRRSRIVSDIH